jgi:dolichol-phosphate mannosyltransferase
METKYSIIIPIKDEEENIALLIKEIENVMEKVGEPWEVICIDDGSKDSSLVILRDLKLNKDNLQVLIFDKNYGQTSAFDAGFKHAHGEVIIMIDGDRQNDPKDIPALLKALNTCDMACGWRRDRKDPITKKITSRIANFIRGRVCKDGLEDVNCSLKAFKKSCFRDIKLFNGMHRFLPVLFQIEGFTIKAVPVNHRERQRGISKYNIFNRFLSPIIDMFVVAWMRKRHLSYQFREKL